MATAEVGFIIDGGHGGSDPGALGNGIIEKVYTLEATLYQAKRLKELGIPYGLTRSTDTALPANVRPGRVKAVGKQVAAKKVYCLSNHINAANGRALGYQLIYGIRSDKKFVNALEHELDAIGRQKNRVYTRTLPNGADYYYMIRETKPHDTVIIEYGFLDTPADAAFMKVKANRERMYESTVKAMAKVAGVTYRKPGQTAPAKPKPSAPDASKNSAVKRPALGAGSYVQNTYKSPLALRRKADFSAKAEETMPIGQVLTVVKKVKTPQGTDMYLTKAGWYVTAHPTYVDYWVVKGKAEPVNPYAGKKLVARKTVNFRSTADMTIANVMGSFSAGMSFPTIDAKVDGKGGPMYAVRNSKGDRYYVTANEIYVKVEKQ